MSLRETLQGVVESVEGALAAVIMAYDGISIDEFSRSQGEFDLQLLSVEYATVLKEIKRAVEVIKVGEMEEVSITTGQFQVVMHTLNEELFVVLIMARDGNYGKGRYMLRLKSFELARELR